MKKKSATMKQQLLTASQQTADQHFEEVRKLQERNRRLRRALADLYACVVNDNLISPSVSYMTETRKVLTETT